MTDKNIQNNAAFVEIGRRAASQWLDASVKGEGGDALATHALYLAARTCTFTAVINTGSTAEPVLEHFDFELADLETDPRNADGSVDGKMKQARTVAIADKVFGLSELDNASKQRIRRALTAALYLSKRNTAMSDEDYFAAVSTRVVKVKHAGSEKMTTCLVVPYGAIYAPPAEDADDEEKQHYQRNMTAPQTLHGKDKASLNELRKRANPPKVSRDSNGAREQDAGRSFTGAVDYVSAMLAQWTNPEGETDVAPNKELRLKLFTLQSQIAAVFAADPLTDEEMVTPADEEKKAA
jgi:hypothetical protein